MGIPVEQANEANEVYFSRKLYIYGYILLS